MTDLSDAGNQLFDAISFGKIHKVNARLKHLDDINVRNGLKRTLLIHTVSCASEALCSYIVRLLLYLEIDTNIQDMFGRTALMYACADVNKDDVVRQLMRYRYCNPNVRDEHGNTALMYAVAYRNKQAIEYLKDDSRTCHKLKLGERNSHGQTAEDVALSMNLPDIASTLQTKPEVIQVQSQTIESTSGST